MIAMLTGIISESMFEKNQTRASEERAEREQKRELLKQKCIELFASVDKDEEEEADPEKLEEVLPYVREMFEKLDLEYMEHDFDNIITLCDTDDSGSISEAEFVSGILSLCDGVRAASIQEVYYIVSQMNAKVKRMELFNDEVLRITKKAIPELQADMKIMMQNQKAGASVPKFQAPPLTKSNTAPVSGSVSGGVSGVDANALLQSTQACLCEMRAGLAVTMDEHTELLSKKIEDLQANVRELCSKPEHLNGKLESEKEIPLQSENKGSIGNPCPPGFADWKTVDLSKPDDRKHTIDDPLFPDKQIMPPAASTATSITPLDPPPAVLDIQALLK